MTPTQIAQAAEEQYPIMSESDYYDSNTEYHFYVSEIQEKRDLYVRIYLKAINKIKKELRTAIANYISSEGCSCCQDVENHLLHKNALGKLLKVKMHSDKSGYNFSIYKSK